MCKPCDAAASLAMLNRLLKANRELESVLVMGWLEEVRCLEVPKP